MDIVCLDLEGVLVPEIWIAFAEATGIPELRRTTRDEPDYDKLMAYRLKILEEQMGNTRGFPEIAGGYSTTRHITNAIRRVINTKEDPRETLLNYARTINEEIRIKRREFNLPLD